MGLYSEVENHNNKFVKCLVAEDGVINTKLHEVNAMEIMHCAMIMLEHISKDNRETRLMVTSAMLEFIENVRKGIENDNNL